MDQNVVSRAAVAADADMAAVFHCAGGVKPKNPHDEHLEPEKHSWWETAFVRYCAVHAAPEAEGGA